MIVKAVLLFNFIFIFSHLLWSQTSIPENEVTTPTSNQQATLDMAEAPKAKANLIKKPSLRPRLKPRPKKTTYPNTFEWFAMAGVWKENSLLLKDDSTEYKIDTLNTVTRLGLIHVFYNARLFARYGLIIGQSENSSAVDNFAYFQRSVLLTGGELALGYHLFYNSEITLGISLGGIYRTIKHSLPSEEYRFKTTAQAIPNLSLELSWKLSEKWIWRQSVGTQGKPLDTLWSAGFSFLF